MHYLPKETFHTSIRASLQTLGMIYPKCIFSHASLISLVSWKIVSPLEFCVRSGARQTQHGRMLEIITTASLVAVVVVVVVLVVVIAVLVESICILQSQEQRLRDLPRTRKIYFKSKVDLFD